MIEPQTLTRMATAPLRQAQGKLSPAYPKLLFPRRVQLQSQHSAIPLKVPVGRENLPMAAISHGADQKINCRPGNPTAAAAVAHLCRFFVIAQFKPRIIEGPQIIPKLLEALFLADSRKQPLPHHAHQLCSSVTDELGQGLLISVLSSGPTLAI